MDSYKRSPAYTKQMAEALTALLYANPGQRFGQTVANLARGASPWNLYDEDVFDRIQAALRGQWPGGSTTEGGS